MSYTSAGTRLLITLIGTLLDDSYNTFLIDEPELGLNPKIQNFLASFLYNKTKRSHYFPHIDNLFISTHSHIFLDKKNINNNFLLTNNDNKIDVKEISTIAEFHNLQFNLLGNTFESLFLPSVILIVEGKTDYKYIKKVLEIIYPERKITFIEANGDSEIIPKLNILSNILGDISKSPYKNRIYIILDSTHAPSITTGLTNKGVPTENIIEWENNGIEYYYPHTILGEIFSCDHNLLNNMRINKGGTITLNGITKTKDQLCEEVTNKIEKLTKYNDEFKSKLIDKIK